MNGNNNGLEALAAAANNSENQTRHNEAPVAAASGRDNQQQWQHALSTLGLSGLAPQPAAPAPASLDGSTIMQQLAQRYYMQEVQAKIRQAQDGQNLQALQALFGQHVLGKSLSDQ